MSVRLGKGDRVRTGYGIGRLVFSMFTVCMCTYVTVCQYCFGRECLFDFDFCYLFGCLLGLMLCFRDSGSLGTTGPFGELRPADLRLLRLFGFWFLVCNAATQLATQLHQRRIQVVRSNKVARKPRRLTESNGTPAMDVGLFNVSLK